MEISFNEDYRDLVCIYFENISSSVLRNNELSSSSESIDMSGNFISESCPSVNISIIKNKKPSC
nr:3511_t:CDS:2 [Entrophospora candida]